MILASGSTLSSDGQVVAGVSKSNLSRKEQRQMEKRKKCFPFLQMRDGCVTSVDVKRNF